MDQFSRPRSLKTQKAEARVRRTRSAGRVTLFDVAERAGVSPMTVSRTLRDDSSVTPELAERVRAATRELGYVPDPAARALASQKGSHVTILVPMLTNALFVDLLESAQRVLRAQGLQTFIGITHYDAGEEELLLREQLRHRPAGLLVSGFDHTQATREMIASSGVPCVHMMELGEGEPGTYAVGFSQQEAGRRVTEHLLERGRRRIAFAAAQLDPRTLMRMQGWQEAMRAAGIDPKGLDHQNAGHSSLALGATLLNEILAKDAEVDAIFFCNDDLAQGALLEAQRRAIPIPQRLAIVGFNDLTGSDQMIPPLTTIHTPRIEIGAVAARMLLKLMRGETVNEPVADVGFELIRRQSS